MNKELVLKITGEVAQSNFPEFKTEALAMIQSADKPLVCDQDFADAEKTVKDFKAAEDAIKAAKAESLKEVADINKLFESLDEVSEALRTTRLSLNKKVTKEKAERKQQVVDAGCEKLKKAIDIVAVTVPEIHNAISVRRNLFEDAVSGKRKIESMEEAVDALLKFEDSRLIDLQVLLLDNKRLISDCEFPSLFPDSAQVVCKPSSEVQSLIDGRVAKHQLAERERKEKAEAKAKAEKERKEKAAAAAKAKVEEDKRANELASQQQEESTPVPKPAEAPSGGGSRVDQYGSTTGTTTGTTKTPTQQEPVEPGEAEQQDNNYVMTVSLKCTATQARAMANEIYGRDIVSDVKLKNG